MKYFIVLPLIAGMFAISGCSSTPPVVTTVACTLESAVVSTAAISVASGLQCSNEAAIAASIQTVANGISSICAPAPTPTPSPTAAVAAAAAALKGKPLKRFKSVGSDICDQIATQLVNGLVNGSIPTAWGCTAANAETLLATYVNQGCTAVFPN